MYVCVIWHMAVHAHGAQQRVWYPLELDLQVDMKPIYVGAGNQT